MSFEWEQNDGGRSFSRRPRQKEDCTVRALAIATGTDYDECYDLLRERGRNSHRRFPFSIITKEVILGHVFVWYEYNWQKTAEEFCNEFTDGTFIIQVKGHVMCLKDGIVYDTGKVEDDRKVKGAWRIERARKARRKGTFKPHVAEQDCA